SFGGGEDWHAPALVVLPLGGVLGAPIQPNDHRRCTAIREMLPEVRRHPRAQQDPVSRSKIPKGRRQVVQSKEWPVVEAMIDSDDDGVAPAVEQPSEADFLSRGHSRHLRATWGEG